MNPCHQEFGLIHFLEQIYVLVAKIRLMAVTKKINLGVHNMSDWCADYIITNRMANMVN